MSRPRKYTKEFRQSMVGRVEQGVPLKRLARDYGIDPAAIRQWRDEWRELGAEAFSTKAGQRFTKDFKESAVRRVEQGTPLKEVARGCRIEPQTLRRWREEFRGSGANAFAAREPKTKVLIIRLTSGEHTRLKEIVKAAGARTVSDFARSRLLN